MSTQLNFQDERQPPPRFPTSSLRTQESIYGPLWWRSASLDGYWLLCGDKRVDRIGIGYTVHVTLGKIIAAVGTLTSGLAQAQVRTKPACPHPRPPLAQG